MDTTNKGMTGILGSTEGMMARDFITLLRTGYNLKLVNLFLESSMEYFGVRTWERTPRQHRDSSASLDPELIVTPVFLILRAPPVMAGYLGAVQCGRGTQ